MAFSQLRAHWTAQRYPSLSARDDNFMYNDGRSARLLRADGTIPIYYNNVKARRRARALAHIPSETVLFPHSAVPKRFNPKIFNFGTARGGVGARARWH